MALAIHGGVQFAGGVQYAVPFITGSGLQFQTQAAVGQPIPGAPTGLMQQPILLPCAVPAQQQQLHSMLLMQQMQNQQLLLMQMQQLRLHQPQFAMPQMNDETRRTLRLTAAEVMPAVESLYTDGLKPYGRILRKRLLELAEAQGSGKLELELKDLKAACESCPGLKVEENAGGTDWAALIPGRRDDFVDVYSSEDVYSEELWAHAERYFSNMHGGMALPGGRFACAQVLVQQRLHFLVGLSLGQVCHFVQLAISHRKLLGYTNGTLVPYERSESRRKDQSAMNRHPCPGKASGRNTFATWDIVRRCIQKLFESSHARQPRVPLSNIKRVFRAQFQIELSETALGYAKLSELFQDSRLEDLCSVAHCSFGYAIVPPLAPARAAGATSSSAAGAARTGVARLPEASPLPQLRAPSSQRQANSPSSPRSAPASAAEAPTSRRRASVAPRVAPLSMELILGDAEAAPPVPAAKVAEVLAHRRLPATPPVGICLATPSPSAALPTLLGSLRTCPAPPGAKRPQASPTAAAFEPTKLMTSSPRASRPTPLSPNAAVAKSASIRRRFATGAAPTLSPAASPEARPLGFSVQNTFIHFALPPPTPFACACSRVRAQSLPRER